MTALTQEQIWLSTLAHEVRSMAELPAFLSEYHQAGPTVLWAACLEATLFHARALIEFLSGRPRRDGSRGRSTKDFQPGDFLPGWELPNPERFDVELDLIDAHLAHLSKRRGADGVMGPGFVTSLVDKILGAMEEFELALAGTEHFVSVQTSMEVARQYRKQGPLMYPPS